MGLPLLRARMPPLLKPLLHRCRHTCDPRCAPGVPSAHDNDAPPYTVPTPRATSNVRPRIAERLNWAVEVHDDERAAMDPRLSAEALSSRLFYTRLPYDIRLGSNGWDEGS